MRFAVQAGVSVGGPAADSGCQGLTHPVNGALSPADALARLLPPSCDFDVIDARAYRIRARSPGQSVPATGGPSTAATLAPPLEEIIVTAEKRSEPLRASPFAVSAISGESIARLGATSFAELARQLPGVAETNLGPGRNKIFIRGISDGAFTGRTQSTVGLYLDDVPITYNAPDPDLRLADVEQIEVLRGPQGTLYGSGSIGGIVRIVTGAPDPTGYAAGFNLEGMLNQHGDRSWGGEAMLNVPLLHGRAAVRAVAYADELAGYLDNPVLGLKDVNHGRRSGGRVAGLVDLPDGWQAQLHLTRQSIVTADSQYIQGGGRSARTSALLEPHDNDFALIGGTLSRAGAKADLRISGAYIDHDLSTRYDATGAFDLPAGQMAAFDEMQEVELWVAEAVAQSRASGRLRWLAGAFGSIAHDASGGTLDARVSGGVARSVYHRADRLTEGAIFGELTYELTPRLLGTMGGRLFSTSVNTRSGDFQLAQPPLPTQRRRLRDQGFAPKARLSYTVSPEVVGYLQVQDGYRAGGFDVPAAADGTPSARTVSAYRPDRLRSYEVGGEATLLDRTLTLRGAAFRAVWKNVQTDQFRPSGLPVTLNIGDGSNTGVEFFALWTPDAHWRVGLGGLIGEPQLTRTSDVFPAKVDIGLPGVAKRTASADLSYGWSPWNGVRAEVAAQGAYVGRSFLTFDGGVASAMGDYGQVRVAFTLRGQAWQAQAFVDNVTDEEGNTFAYGNPFSRTRSRQETPLPPRTFGLALRRGF